MEIILLALGALLIFFMFSSRRKQKARMQEISDNLVPGVEVMTSFGVFGTVMDVNTETMQVTIESGPGTTLRVHRQAIGQIQTPAVTGPVDSSLTADDTLGRDPVASEPVIDVAPDSQPSTTGPANAEDPDGPRITDAELDAINEAKRQENSADAGGVEAADADRSAPGSTAAGGTDPDDTPGDSSAPDRR